MKTKKTAALELFFLFVCSLGWAEKPIVETPPVQKANESRAELKVKASRGYYLGLGPAGLWKVNSPGLAYSFNGGYAFDFETVSMRLGGEFVGRSGSIGIIAGMGLFYFPQGFSWPNFHPFVGLDLGYGTIRLNESNGILGAWVPALVVGPSLGVNLFRSTDVNLELGLKWGFFLNGGALGNPSYCLLKASLFFF